MRDYFKRVHAGAQSRRQCSSSTRSAAPRHRICRRKRPSSTASLTCGTKPSSSPSRAGIVCHIHFKFPDGSKIKRAFTYDWRLWTLPELRELLIEAGFAKVRVYWEGDDGDGGGNGEFKEHATGEPDLAWIAYIVAEK